MIGRGSPLLNPNSFASIAAGRKAVHLRVIETTDLHLHLLPYDYYADRPWDGIGLISAAGAIEQARAEVPNALLFDNGDFLQGTPMGDYVAYERGLRDGDVHPIISAMNSLRFDAITLGNHEFNYGLDFLDATLCGAEFPVVSSNLAKALGPTPREDETLVKPYALLRRKLADQSGVEHDFCIGVIGFAPPQILQWDSRTLDGRLHARDIVEAAKAWVPEMREAGADVIVALAHTGIGASRHTPGMENAAVPLASVDGIDALLTGHSHLIFPSPVFANVPGVDVNSGTIHGKPAVMGGCWGAHIGIIDMLLVRENDTWAVIGSRSEVRQTGGTGANAFPKSSSKALQRAIEAAHEDTLCAIRKPVGRTETPYHSYFTHLGELDALRVVADAQRDYVARMLAGTQHASLPILSAVAPFKSGGRSGPAGYTDIPPGELALRHISDLYAFPNAIAALRVKGQDVLEWLERSASTFNQIRSGSHGTLLRDPEFPGYNFEVIFPLDVEFDLRQPARYDPMGTLLDDGAHRVSKVLLNGQPLDLKGDYILCTNSYRAGGAGAFAGASTKNVVYADEKVTRDIIRDYVAEKDIIAPSAGGRIRLRPIKNTSVIFESGPGAHQYLPQIAHFNPEPRGLTRQGFLRLKLDLSLGA